MIDSSDRKKTRDLTRSFIVQAAAGSGKTTLLINRFILALASSDRPEKVLAITFTKKAAEEMRERVMAFLNSCEGELEHELALALKIIKDKSKSKKWNLHNDPSRLSIMTMDAFCVWLKARVPSGRVGAHTYSIEEFPEDLYKKSARRAISQFVLQEGKKNQNKLLTNLDNDWIRLEKFIIGMLAHRQHYLMDVGLDLNKDIINKSYRNYAEQKISDVRTSFSSEFLDQLISLYNYSAFNLNEEKIPSSFTLNFKNIELWQKILKRIVFNQDLSLKKRITKSSGFPSAGLDKNEVLRMKSDWKDFVDSLNKNRVLRDGLSELANLHPTGLSEFEGHLLKETSMIFKYATAYLNLTFIEHRKIDFCQLLLDGLNLLDEKLNNEYFYDNLGFWFTHILVDEVQDTSAAQLALISKIIGYWDGDKRNSLFMVGDFMQSIYRFRKALPEHFNEMLETGEFANIHLDLIILKSNFRSQSELVKWVNDIMPKIIEANGCDNLNFKPQIAVKKSEERPVAFFNTKKYGDEHEAKIVLEIIKKISIKANRNGEKITVGILARSRSHLHKIIQQLNKSNITFVTSDIRTIKEFAVVNELLAITRCLLHPEDKVAFLTFISGPWIGMSLAEIYDFTDSFFSSNFKNLRQNDPRLSCYFDLIDLLEAGRKELQFLTLSSVVMKIWHALDGGQYFTDSNSFLAANIFFKELNYLENEEKLITNAKLESRLNVPFSEADHSGNIKIQLMTIHKSKGLEFDYVILPGLNKRPRYEESSIIASKLVKTRKTQSIGLVAPFVKDDLASFYNFVNNFEKRNRIDEVIRLLYVVLTRAKNKIFILGEFERTNNSDDSFSSQPNSLQSLLASALERPQIEEFNFSSLGSIKKKKDIYKKVVLAKDPLKSHHYESYKEPEFNKINLEFDWATNIARCVGIIIHEILERIDNSSFGLDKDRWKLNCINYAEQRIWSLGLSTSKERNALDRIKTCLQNISSSERCNWLFSSDHHSVQTEYQVMTSLRGSNENLIMDRIFTDKKKVNWVVDFKTGYHRGKDLENFLQEEIKRHRPQLNFYGQIMSELRDGPLMLGIYFPLYDFWHQWPHSEIKEI
ncbi:MAG: UvrD-helicase domain-containing protein [Pseudomonadota bacterium]|nr:UvrD-helicase domain-containing protein [Pseudomonadota bacterium]